MFEPPSGFYALPFAILTTLVLGQCGNGPPTDPTRETPIDLKQRSSTKADRKPKPSPGPDPSSGAELSAAELLGDPFLAILLASLHDPVSGGEIVSAIEATESSLEDGQTEAAISSLEEAYEAMATYLSVGDVDDEDVIHLDAAERFLDEVESLISSEKSRGKKTK
jgi:hypothetical protein